MSWFMELFGKSSDGTITASPTAESAPLFFFNTFGLKKREFRPIKAGTVSMYNCGPTVYDFAHIGNMRSYIFADTLRRVFEYNNLKVKQVINITDVGHLTDNADSGEDRVENQAKKEQKTAKEITDFYTEKFTADLRAINIPVGKIIFPRATEHIGEQIAFIKTLEEKGYTYKTSDGVYFDTSKFPSYGKLGGINLKGLQEGARVEANPEKKNPTDFALWKFSVNTKSDLVHKPEEKRQQEWPSPWGTGFPGWHIECSAMSMKYLGRQFDIHTGGIDHIPVHHNNEIAQTESVTGRTMANFWLHNDFLTIEGRKISKSLGNTITLDNLANRAISPLAFRYWLLTGHYRTPMNFTWEAAEGASAALKKLRQSIVFELGQKIGKVNTGYQKRFHQFVNDDLNTARAIALIWDILKDEKISKEDKRATILDFDKVLGLKLADLDQTAAEMRSAVVPQNRWPKEIAALVAEREKARATKDWKRADELRAEISKKGYVLKDTPQGPELSVVKKIGDKLVR